MREPHPLSVAYYGVQLYRSTTAASSFACSERSYEESQDHAHTRKQLLRAEMKVSICTNFVVGLFTEEEEEEEEEDGEIGILAVFRVSL